MPVVDSVVHLGNTLQFNLSDKLDIHSKSMSFICKANTVLFHFKCTDPRTKMKLFQSYCFSLYGSCLWRLDCEELNSLSASFNNIIRRIWNLPRISRTSIVGIHNIVYDRFSSLCTSALFHPSSLVHTIFTDSSRTCNSNFIGYNCLYGASHCKSYSSSHHVTNGNLVREIRSTHTFIPHFSHSELEAIVSAVVL